MNKSRPFDYWLLWFIALLSLVGHAGWVGVLLVARQQAGVGVTRAAQAVGGLRAASIDYPVHLQQSLPISLTLPVSTTVSVPISATVPIDTQITVPVTTAFGTFHVTVPVKTTIPVDIQPAVPIRLTVPVSTTVPVVLDVPVHIALADTALGQSLSEAQSYLEALAAQLGASPAR
ncbi:MAG: hypothetical protein HY784_18125 [Chloroflexi bacterium]|nr:hypothetical protein [Chloroflexota bacterium]